MYIKIMQFARKEIIIIDASDVKVLSNVFFFLCYGDHRDLHSFPTRRSSDRRRERSPPRYPAPPFGSPPRGGEARARPRTRLASSRRPARTCADATALRPERSGSRANTGPGHSLHDQFRSLWVALLPTQQTAMPVGLHPLFPHSSQVSRFGGGATRTQCRAHCQTRGTCRVDGVLLERSDDV